ncbi:Chromatin modification-related protein [Mycena sanguinolenta]|uniref:Chromatin modification-related protein n=1 Tax=Mycena sanguinolenta TaxID=230812 RepID=A0A8H7DAF4_9AGAR|nr:Chromatin modification-related protein [Mycena sanguinolenta]
MNANAQSLEDASTIVSEFIYSLDNLPNEVAHLLQEIKEKEIKVQDLQADIDRDSSRYIRHSLKASNSASSSSASVSPSPAASRAPSPKSALIPAKISAAYAEINTLSAEKCALAQRIIDLVSRTRARLDADLTKVRVLQGETLEPAFSGAATPITSTRLARTPSAISESLRTALGGSVSMPEIRQQAPATPAASSASASISSGPSTKKRRITAAPTSIKLAPVIPPTPPRRSASPLTTASTANAHSSSHKRSRLSRQIHPTREEMDVDAEGEEEAEGEDENLYCFCQKPSYGEMIACDNDDCPYEWFHLSCVQLTQPTPEKWYCRECIEKGFSATAGQRKGRKR